MINEMIKSLSNLIRPMSSKEQRTFLMLYLKCRFKKRNKKFSIKFLDYHFKVLDGKSFLWQFYEIFVKKYYDFKCATDNPIIVDCGSNVGLSVAFFRLTYPNAIIEAYEADPKIFELLKHNLQQNGIEEVKIFNKAVWIDENGVQFNPGESDSGSIFKNLKDNDSPILIDSIRLKDTLQKINKIDMLKMDIEGAEIDVLKDCRNDLRNVQNLFIEYHDIDGNQQYLSLILKILEENGFRYHIQNDKFDSKKFWKSQNLKENILSNLLQVNIFARKS